MSAREQRCAWIAPSEEPNARYLVPGCWTRVLDWDAECTCKTTAQEMDEADAKIARLERELQRISDDHHALISTVGKHPDARALLEAADKSAAEWRAIRAKTTQANARERSS